MFYNRCTLTLLTVCHLWGCCTEIPKEEFVAFYDKKCKSEINRSGVNFFAIALTPDYERAKWGQALDSGMRVIFGATPRSNLTFEDAFLTDGSDTLNVILHRKIQTFEIGSADMFVLSFANQMNEAKLRLRNVSHGIGGIEIKLKDCRNIRLKEK